jgi:hypothetical protein
VSQAQGVRRHIPRQRKFALGGITRTDAFLNQTRPTESHGNVTRLKAVVATIIFA